MSVWRSLEEFPGGLPYPVLTIGNFDGVHLGHRRILEIVCRRATEAGGTPLLLTFDPHPARIVAPERVPPLLTPLPMKLTLLEQAGLAGVLVLPFTRELSQLTPEQFARQILKERLATRKIIVGDNFRFGHRQAGDVRALMELGPRLGFAVNLVPAVRLRGQAVSSTRLRQLIAEGQLTPANRLLGRCFSIRGRIVPGRGIGRREAVPTLNLEPYAGLLPACGIYVTETICDGQRATSVTSVGYSPTFDINELRVECFLLEAPPPPGASQMEVVFWHRLRDEVKFSSAEALKDQIARDIEAARAFFRRLRRPQAATR